MIWHYILISREDTSSMASPLTMSTHLLSTTVIIVSSCMNVIITIIHITLQAASSPVMYFMLCVIELSISRYYPRLHFRIRHLTHALNVTQKRGNANNR
ncbi:hypothetical protein GGR51DRAFT_320440 [Nemania sp. FL0031]|nr:hypothetical protein GGR51DRAFT_320440 [Nemania sp. FL0031]